MLHFLPGIVLAQLVVVGFLWLNFGAPVQQILLNVALPAALVSVLTALWFVAITRTVAEKRVSDLTARHAAEIDRIRQVAERERSDVMQKASADQARLVERSHADREKLVKKAHKEVLKAERSANRRANIKVYGAWAVVSALGIVFLITELITLGLFTLTAAGSALGGYLLRWWQSGPVPVADAVSDGRAPTVIEQRSTVNRKDNSPGELSKLPELKDVTPDSDSVFALEDDESASARNSKKILPDPNSARALELALLNEPDRKRTWSDRWFKR